MRISDWSSDVCSSDLGRLAVLQIEDERPAIGSRRFPLVPVADETRAVLVQAAAAGADERPPVLYVLRLAAEAGAFAGHVAPDEQALAVGRQLETRDIGLFVGDLRRRAGVGAGGNAPELVAARRLRNQLEQTGRAAWRGRVGQDE